MGMRMPQTCWAVFKRQAINLRNCCIWLVDSIESIYSVWNANLVGYHSLIVFFGTDYYEDIRFLRIKCYNIYKMRISKHVIYLNKNYQVYVSWFQTFAVFCMLYVFFWAIPRHLNFICRRFGTLCSIFIGGEVLTRLWRWNRHGFAERMADAGEEESIQIYICPFHREGNVPVELQGSSELTELSQCTTDVWFSWMVIKLETAMANQMYSTFGV